MNMTKVNHASSMMIEDHLKRCLAKTSNKPFKVLDNKYLPKALHSPFGDFPKEYLPPKKNAVTEIEPIVKYEQSIAAVGVRKFNSVFLSYFCSHFEKRRGSWRKSHKFVETQGQAIALKT